MKIASLFTAVAVLGLGACDQAHDSRPVSIEQRANGDNTQTLPFYASVDLTPRWTQTSDHRLTRFDLLTQTGARVTADDLRGRIHVASFIFTRCSGICPTMVMQLKRVQDRVGASRDVVLVSYSVTPDLDKPEDLAAFGRMEGIDPARWILVTGEQSQIYGLARSFYFADDGRLSEAGGADEFLHTEKVLLVDRDGRLRGVYNGTQAFDMERLLEDIQVLLAEKA